MGKITFDQSLQDREIINLKVVDSLKENTESWGIEVLRHEIKDIRANTKIREIMTVQAESERKRRATILESEGIMQETINAAQAAKQEILLNAQAQAAQIILQAEATSNRINYINDQISKSNSAAEFSLAEKYLSSLGELAKQEKKIVLKNNLSNPEEVVQKSKQFLE